MTQSETFVLDASAVLAALLKEPGDDVVRQHREAGVIGSVNLAEVLTRLEDLGVGVNGAINAVAALKLRIMPFTQALAERTAMLRPLTRSAGLSLGDRACLALAQEMGLPVLTADRRWSDVAGAVGVRVQLIR